MPLINPDETEWRTRKSDPSMAKFFADILLRIFGWKAEGVKPSESKYVIIGGLHTSNWDFVLMVLLAASLGVKYSVIGKDAVMKWPWGGLMRRLGVIPIDRSSRHNVVQQMVDLFEERDSLALIVAAEGTRSRREYWKSGFYHIAKLAGVPLAMAYLDYGRKRGGFGGTFMPSGDVRCDMDIVREYLADVTPKRPEKSGPIRLREEDAIASEVAGE